MTEVLEEQGPPPPSSHRFMLGGWAQNQMRTRRPDDGAEEPDQAVVQIHPYYSIYLKQIVTARARTPTPGSGRRSTQVLRPSFRGVQGDETVQQALDSAAEAD